MKKYFLFLFFFIAQLNATDNPIMSIKKIELPGFELAFNPSLIEWENGYLLTFRYLSDPKKYWISHIGVVILDLNFDPVTPPQILNTRLNLKQIPTQAEDARIISLNGELHLVYNDNLDVENPTHDDRRDIFVAKLKYEKGQFNCLLPIKLVYPIRYVERMWEKNWVPFEWLGKLMFGYTIVPHEVLEPDFTKGIYKKAHQTSANHTWKCGTLRGGTPALLVDGEYLSFFHSSIPQGGWKEQKLKYFLGAYTFSPKPPFEITKMTLEPLEKEGFYVESDYHKQVIFPGGFVVKGGYIHLAYGRDDSEIWIATIDKMKLQKLLAPIVSKK